MSTRGKNLSYLFSANPEFLDSLLKSYLENPDSVDESWRYFFEGLEIGSEVTPPKNGSNGQAKPATTNGAASESAPKSSFDLSTEAKVADLINAYRGEGHLLANINPLNEKPTSHPLLELSRFGLSEKDMERSFTAGNLIGMGPATLRAILQRLNDIYCSSIGVEFMHIKDAESREWLRKKMESSGNRLTFSDAEKKRVFDRLAESETFERFLHTRYVAQKRFSIEGAESLIPALDRVIDAAADLGGENLVMGMSHRGRLNVLTNVFGKKPEFIFTEFEQEYSDDGSLGEGDVKYHMGFSADVTAQNGKKLHLTLASNPSHLQFVHPVVEGITRGKQRIMKDKERKKTLPVVIHGEAAFAGQGVVYETLNLSQVRGYWTGGTIHFIINNQVGFTTDPADARSTTYATDVARMLEVPIFHVNSDDPEAVVYLAQLSTEYRQKFGKDVVIDLICYRKYGHNEGDEPSFTQPLMYRKIKEHPSTREIYGQKLAKSGVLSLESSQQWIDSILERLTQAQKRTREEKPKPFVSAFESGAWSKYRRPSEGDIFAPVKTQVSAIELKALSQKLNSFPEGFNLHPKLNRLFESRLKAVEEGKGIDWGNGEILAYASLLTEGYAVRISGQDVQRGTFTHRHAVLSDFNDGKKYCPLDHVREGQEEFFIFNSTLSETGVLAFEYGWSLGDPSALVVWEAQFGDFANGAQVIIDQFISSSESKWQRACGLVMLLPHGYEGQGPEHSSARLERFLQMCARFNMSVCYPTTPAQLFHMLRRQLKRDFRKPLIVMTPKSLLRNPVVVSELKDFSEVGFEEVLDDTRFLDDRKAAQAARVLMCSGKVYYDLLQAQTDKKIENIALVRVEQLYPWPEEKLRKILSRYSGVKEFFWVQEEPQNMGAWIHVYGMWNGALNGLKAPALNKELRYFGRGPGAAPAVGSHKKHLVEQAELIENSLNLSRR